jgi:hypothetical protein
MVPKDAGNEEAAGLASLESGQTERAAQHLERALELDPLLISATTELAGGVSKTRTKRRSSGACPSLGALPAAITTSRIFIHQ